MEIAVASTKMSVVSAISTASLPEPGHTRRGHDGHVDDDRDQRRERDGPVRDVPPPEDSMRRMQQRDLLCERQCTRGTFGHLVELAAVE